jgi:hypothetical protein
VLRLRLLREVDAEEAGIQLGQREHGQIRRQTESGCK